MAATSLAKSPPSLMKFFRSSNPVFPFFDAVLCRSSPLDRLLGIKLIFDITFLTLTSPPSLFTLSFEFPNQKPGGNPFFVTKEILFSPARKSSS